VGWARSEGVNLKLIPTFQAAISIFKDAPTFFKLVFIFWKQKPDLVHTHTFKAGLLGRLAAWITGVPLIVHTYHGHLLSGYWGKTKTNLVSNAEKWLARITTKTIAVSSQVASDLISQGIVPQNKMSVIELGFDIPKLESQLLEKATLRTDLGLTQDDELVGVVGRLVPVKGIDLFLEALIPLLEARPKLHLAIIGDGAERQKYEQYVKKSGAKRVHFCGWRNPVVPDLKDLDVCVCSSRNEGTSVSIIEAVIAKVPIVSTNVGGMSDLLESGKWGELVPRNELALRNAVVKVLEQRKDLAFIEKLKEASEFFKKRFSTDRLVDEVNALYHQLEEEYV
jgi:glycosyltransferase involved in cell wall biosynthesis